MRSVRDKGIRRSRITRTLIEGVPVTDATVFTHDLRLGEVKAVEGLKSRLSIEIDHKVVAGPKLGRPDGSSFEERVIAALRRHDAMGCPNQGVLPAMPGPRSSLSRPRTITGAGGELAHGHYYPEPGSPADRAWLAKMAKPRWVLKFVAKQLERKASVHGGAHDDAKNLVRALIRSYIGEGATLGVTGLNLLDFFYLVERLRRWNGDGKDASFLAPLVCIPSVRAAFSLTPQERVDVVLPRDLVRITVPEWYDAPYYARSMADPRQNVMLWSGPDREAVGGIIMDDHSWDDAFQADTVREMWTECVANGGPPTREVVFRRVAWFVLFREYLEEMKAAVVVR